MSAKHFSIPFLAVFILLAFAAGPLPAADPPSDQARQAWTMTQVGEPAFDSGWTQPAFQPETPEELKSRTSAYSHGNPTNEEQFILELINSSRADPAGAAMYYGVDLNQGLAPGTISSVPKQPLAFNPRLINAARSHSQWMLGAQTFSHTGQGGSSPGDRMSAAGYDFSGNWMWGENIGWSGTTGQLDVENHARKIIEDLFLSPGHRKNTLTDSFEEIGLGALTGRFNGYNSLMVTEKFARSASTPTPMLVGVVYEDSNSNGRYDIGEGIQGVTVSPDRGSYHAVTSSSGGFAIPLGNLSGSLTVTASGGGLSQPITRQVSLTGKNVKLDFVDSGEAPDISEREKMSRILNWVEYLLPEFGLGYEFYDDYLYFRWYPEVDVYIGGAGGKVLYFEPAYSSHIFDIGPIDLWFEAVRNDGF